MEGLISMDLLIFVIGTVFSIVGYFLKQKDDQQASQIKLLFEKHDANVKELQEHKLKIAERHYERDVVDGKIDDIKRTVKEGFDSLGAKFDKLSEALTQHLREGK